MATLQLLMLLQDAAPVLSPLRLQLDVLEPLALRLRFGQAMGGRGGAPKLPPLPLLRLLFGSPLRPLLLPLGGWHIICATNNFAFSIGISTGPVASRHLAADPDLHRREGSPGEARAGGHRTCSVGAPCAGEGLEGGDAARVRQTRGAGLSFFAGRPRRAPALGTRAVADASGRWGKSAGCPSGKGGSLNAPRLGPSSAKRG